MRSIRRAALTCLCAFLLIGPLAAMADAGQLHPMPINPADPGPTLGPPVVIESQPSVGTPTQPTLTQPTIITVADAGQTVMLRPGERFSLELGDGYLWNVSIADDTIVGRVDDGLIFEALQPGSTSLLVSGDPACYRLRTRCLIPSVGFEVQLVVG
jgi:hypothetical protein